MYTSTSKFLRDDRISADDRFLKTWAQVGKQASICIPVHKPLRKQLAHFITLFKSVAIQSSCGGEKFDGEGYFAAALDFNSRRPTASNSLNLENLQLTPLFR